MNELITLVGLAVLANAVSWWFEPFLNFKTKYKEKKYLGWLDSGILNCPKCFGLWSSLPIAFLYGYHILFFPLVVSFLAYLISVHYYVAPEVEDV